MVVVARLMARQELERARMRQAHEIEMEKIKAEETQENYDKFSLSDEDFLDSGDEIDFDEADDDKEFELGEDEDGEFEEEEQDEDRN